MQLNNLSVWPFSDILAALETWWFKLFVLWPLEIVDKFSIVIKYLSGASVLDLLFKNDNNNLFGVSNIFLMFIIIGVVLIGILIMTNVLSSWFSKTENSSGKLSRSFTGTIKGLIFMIGVPVFFMIFNTITSGITTMVFNNMENEGSLSDIIFRMGYSVDATHSQEWINNQHYWQIPDFLNSNYGILLPAFGSIFLLVIFLMLGISLVSRALELLLLYFCSPMFGASAVQDGGHRLMVWRDLVLAKFTSSTVSVLAFVIFTQAMPKISTIDIGGWTANNILRVLFITAGSISTLKAQVMLSGLIGQQTGISEGFSTLVGMKATATAGKTAFGGVKRMLFGGSKGGKSGAGSGSTSGLLSNTTSALGKTYNGMANVTGRASANMSNLKNHGLKTNAGHHTQNVINSAKSKISFGIYKTTKSFSSAFEKSKIGGN